MARVGEKTHARPLGLKREAGIRHHPPNHPALPFTQQHSRTASAVSFLNATWFFYELTASLHHLIKFAFDVELWVLGFDTFQLNGYLFSCGYIGTCIRTENKQINKSPCIPGSRQSPSSEQILQEHRYQLFQPAWKTSLPVFLHCWV